MLLAFLTLIIFFVSITSIASDVSKLRIPNSHSLIIIGCFLTAFVMSPESFGAWWEHFGAALGMFVITYIMFALGMLGGGDSKLGTALALWVGLKGLMAYVFYMALMGGIVGIASLLLGKYKPCKNPPEGSWLHAAQSGKKSIPYGIALVFGCWMALAHTGFINQVIDELIKIIH